MKKKMTMTIMRSLMVNEINGLDRRMNVTSIWR